MINTRLRLDFNHVKTKVRIVFKKDWIQTFKQRSEGAELDKY